LSSSLKYLSFWLTSSLILWQCASIQSPSGGKKDLTPPLVIKTFPEQGATNANPSTIELEFDEFFVLKNLLNELLISPPLNQKPIVFQKGKALFIELKEALNQNSTYTINLGKGIADLHEGNVLENYTLVFSTGSELDSLLLSGTIYSCPQKNLPKGLIVAAYEKSLFTKDSTIFLQKPDYFSIADEQGHFQIQKMKAGQYELIAFEDVNSNYQIDHYTEKIAFHPKAIQLKDSVDTNLWLYQQEDELKILDQTSKQGSIKWVFNKKVDSFDLLSDPEVKYFSKTIDDSLFIWPRQTQKDSVLFILNVENSRDSLMYSSKITENVDIRISQTSNNYVKNGGNYTCFTTAPIVEIDTSKIQLKSSGKLKDFLIHAKDFELDIEFEYEENQTYQLTFDHGAIKGLHDSRNDSVSHTFFTQKEDALANLKINLENEPKHYFVELLKDGEVFERISAEMPIYFKNLLPDNYELRLVADSNNDGEWTPGSYFENRLPEKVHYYGKVLNLRANWELEIDWKP